MVLGDAVIKVHILNILAAWLCIPIWRVFLYLPLDFWSDIFVHSISVFLDILCALSKGEIKEDWNIIAWTDHQYCKHIIKYSCIVSFIGVSVTKSRRNIKFKILYHNYNQLIIWSDFNATLLWSKHAVWLDIAEIIFYD